MITKIKDLGTVITGNTPKTSDFENYASCDIPFVKPSDLNEDEITQIDFTEFYISEYARDKARVVPPNSVFMTCIGIIGKVGINQRECAFNQQINVVVPDENKCLPEYLAYALINMKSILQATANAPVVPILNKSQFGDIEIDIPNLEVQEEIVSKLRKIDCVINNRNLQLSKLDELVKSRFVELFGDPVASKKKRKLAEIGRVFTGNTPPMKEPSYYESKDIPFIKPSDLSESVVTTIDGAESYVSEKARSIARIIPPNAVLVTCIGTIGKIGITARESCCNQQMNFVVPNSVINSVYLAHCLTFFKSTLQSIANAPVVPIINKSQFSELEIPVFDMDKQKQFATFVAQTNKSKLAVQHSLEILETLKKALMQKYFG